MSVEPQAKSKPSVESVAELYRTMQMIRQTEEELARCHQQGLVHGACHTYVGQEAIATGVCHHLQNEDVVFSTHRGHGHAIAKGMPPRDLIAELLGRADGCSRGRGGSMHLFSPEIGMMGTSGIVGPCILQACGGGYSSKILGNGTVAVAFFGDGAVNNGAFHEGLNMASIWKLPVIFVCENNQFATEVPFNYSSGNPHVGDRGAAYGMPGFELDGNDVLEISAVAKQAIQRARAGQGPTLIECKTYRTRPHAEGMGDGTYRTREEIDEWKQRCPILRLRKHLVAKDGETESRLDQIDAEVAGTIEQAVNFAQSSEFPTTKSAIEHVYAPPVNTLESNPPKQTSNAREISYGAATLEALAEAMSQDERIFVMGEGIGERGGNFMTTLGLYEKYGADRLCDTPICERGFVGLGCGAAMTGTRPIIDFMFIDFVNDAFGEIINQIAKIQYMSSGRIRMPILLRGCGGIGNSAATHHSGLYHSVYAHFPGIHVVMPATPYDAKGLFAHALKCEDPVLFLEHRSLMALKGPVPEEHYEIPFGQARVVREGHDLSVVAVSLMQQHAIQAAEKLAGGGVSVEIIDPRTISPLDTDTIIQSVAKTGRLLIVDEAFGPCSIGAEISSVVADMGFDYLDAPIRRLNGAFTPTPYSPSLEAAVVPNTATIVESIQRLLEE